MTAKGYFFYTLLIVMLFFQNCASDNKKTARQSPPETTAGAPPQEEPVASTDEVAAESQEKKESPLGKSPEQLRENKTNRIGAVPTGKDAELNTTVPAPPTKVAGKPLARTGPPGYVTKKDVILQAEPSQNAAKVSTLKQYETIYILETKMTDEKGNLMQYPTWYKVERENKERGWVMANGVNAGAGG